MLSQRVAGIGAVAVVMLIGMLGWLSQGALTLPDYRSRAVQIDHVRLFDMVRGATPVVAPPAVQPARGLFVSAVPELSIIPARQIPVNHDRRSKEECWTIRPMKSPEARAVAAQGWLVSAERDGPDSQMMVIFVGREEQGMGGLCRVEGGGVALFRGGQLFALVQGAASGLYGKTDEAEAFAGTPADGSGAWTIWQSKIWSVSESRFRFDHVSMAGGITADVHFDADGAVRITPEASVDTVCDGRALLPNIRSFSIVRAGEALRQYGWRPAPIDPDRPPIDGLVVELHRMGLAEAGECSWSFPGYCTYSYLGEAGELGVTTAGDNFVMDYGVTCK